MSSSVALLAAELTASPGPREGHVSLFPELGSWDSVVSEFPSQSLIQSCPVLRGHHPLRERSSWTLRPCLATVHCPGTGWPVLTPRPPGSFGCSVFIFLFLFVLGIESRALNYVPSPIYFFFRDSLEKLPRLSSNL